ncbi:hypothetical protein [Dermatophilus congolensis]|nr:hypothetical protein [Dermatophilus congolensis]
MNPTTTFADPTPYTTLNTRLQHLARTWPDIVIPLPHLTPEQLTHIDPTYHQAAQALPGLHVLDPDGPLGIWHTYTWHPSTPPTQTLLDTPDATITTIGDNLHITTRDNPQLQSLPATTLDWWTTITTSLETHLPDLAHHAQALLEEEGTTPTDAPEGFTLTQHEILLTLLEEDLTALTHAQL